MSCINYKNLKILNSAASVVKESENSDRHDALMEKFNTIFLRPARSLPAIPNQPTKSYLLSHPHTKRPKSRFAAERGKLMAEDNSNPLTKYDDSASHDIRFYTIRERKKHNTADSQQKNADVNFEKKRNISALLNLMKKFPFERSRKEKKKAYKLLRELWPTELGSLLESDKTQYPVLKELASVAVLDTYNDVGLTVFGNTGLCLILRGSVLPQTLPYIRALNESYENEAEDFPCPTPLLSRKLVQKLTVGDWFGTFKKVEGREINSKVLTLLTLEPCLFLKITIADYQRILSRIKTRIQNEKMSVVQAVAPYDKWASMSVGKLASLIEWKSFPRGSVVMGEGEISPYIVFIRNGCCNVFRQVEAIKTLPNGRKRRIYKNVLMGELKEGDAIGEYSILEQKTFLCTVVATTDLDAGVIYPDRLEELDLTIRTLFSQSVRPKFANITEDDIHSNFIEQQMKDDWNSLKQRVLLQTINHCGIRPGYGKWSKPKVFDT